MKRIDIIKEAIYNCLKECYKKSQPSADFDNILKEIKENEENNKDARIYERYYLSNEEYKYIRDKYIKLYGFNEFELFKFGLEVDLGLSPTSNKNRVQDYWKDYGINLNIIDKNPLLFELMDKYGDNFDSIMLKNYGENWEKIWWEKYNKIKSNKIFY